MRPGTHGVPRRDLTVSHASRIRRLAAIATAGFVSMGVAQLAAPAHATARTHMGSSTRSSTRSARGSSWESRATRTGAPAPSTKLQLAVWLKQRDASGLDRATRAIYTHGSGRYHQWLTSRQVTRAYAPTRHQVAVVERYLRGQGFKVNSVAGNRAYVNVTGTVTQANRAFHVSLGTYRYRGHTYRGTATAPKLRGIAGNHIGSVAGLDTAAAYKPMHTKRHTTPADSSTPWDGVCGDFSTTKSLDFINPTQTKSFTGFIPCTGYTGAQLQQAYGVDQLPADAGAGQTVAIVDAYGSPTILQDANKFSQVSGLPALDSSNFQVVMPQGIGNKKESKAQDPLGWQAEVSIDVEAVHAMAPGAKIVLVVAPNNYASLDEAVNWINIHHIANIVTSSWGLPLDLAAPGQASRDERIFEMAAAQGIGENFSTGDSGDEVQHTGNLSVDFPSSSPWVNAVGGTSLFTHSDGSYDAETGWGDTFYRLATCDQSSTIAGQLHCDVYNQDPSKVLDEGFTGGAGGGLSNIWSAQPWQSSAISGANAAGYGTVGTHRALPDVSMLADPETGMNIWITDQSVGDTAPEQEQFGGTSLASPLFAGIMADVDQARAGVGDGPAGLASQYLYNLPSGAVRDVLPPTFGTTNPSTAAGLDSRSLFYGSFFSGSLFNVGFNADSSLDTAPGWDDVTGGGTPNAPAFVAALP
jgi:subtilase family serine protease